MESHGYLILQEICPSLSELLYDFLFYLKRMTKNNIGRE